MFSQERDLNMRITESRLRSVIRSVIDESSGILNEANTDKYDFIDSCDLKALKEALAIYENMYLRDKQGEDALHRFVGDYCREAEVIKKKNRFSIFGR